MAALEGIASDDHARRELLLLGAMGDRDAEAARGLERLGRPKR
jgi:hypothetical protein